MLAVFHPGQKVCFGGIVALELVDDEHARDVLQRVCQKAGELSSQLHWFCQVSRQLAISMVASRMRAREEEKMDCPHCDSSATTERSNVTTRAAAGFAVGAVTVGSMNARGRSSTACSTRPM